MKRNTKYLLAVVFVLIVLFFMFKPEKTETPKELPSTEVEDTPITEVAEEPVPPSTKVAEPEVVIETEPEPEVAEEKIVPAYNYTAEDLDLLARLICSEGGIESYETQLMIGSVVMNRVSSPKFPNTIREVIYQKISFLLLLYTKVAYL